MTGMIHGQQRVGQGVTDGQGYGAGKLFYEWKICHVSVTFIRNAYVTLIQIWDMICFTKFLLCKEVEMAGARRDLFCWK